MKAVLAREYGAPDRLRVEDVDIPTAKDDEILIRVRAAGLNALNYYMIRGTLIARPFFGLRRPKEPRVGADVAGVVEAVGANVRTFKPSDEVFGVARGALAEFACAPSNKIALKPVNASFDQAAAIPVAAITALQGLRDRAHLQRGQKVLINGAAGGIGTYAVQIAKWMGADVTGVCSTRNLEMVRSLGASHVIDYTREDFAKSTERYDVFADIIGNRSLSDCRGVMTRKGVFLNIGVRDERRLVPRLVGILASSPFVSQDLGLFMAKMTQTDLTVLKELFESGNMTSVIDRTYPLAEAPAALMYVREGHARGKVVVRIP
ncbi:MAG TPA: NAD(P)-dependent alcohol dehydrogenase [Gemmatimonadaceae bacterium]|nr:NAD(P)-dependent alcohol dehydrogenase [Gemmatimonadaceae bacterium]